MIRTKNSKIIFVLLSVLTICIILFLLVNLIKNRTTTKQINKLAQLLTETQQHQTELQDQINQLASGYAELLERPTEIIRREIIKEKSQDELLTQAVARIAPTVVSIVVTKDVPKLEVVYINPFGDDPFFKDFGVRIPRYQQKGTEEKQVGAGTGFIIHSDGYIITNRHVVNDTDAYYTVLLTDASQHQATVIYKDADIDIAILKIDGDNYTYAPFGDSSTLKLGQSVFAIGNALGEYNNSVSVGIISGLNRDIQASNRYQTETLNGVIQTDAAINPGNSGGPLVDLQGKIIGVNVATVRGSENIGFAIPVNMLQSILSKQLP